MSVRVLIAEGDQEVRDQMREQICAAGASEVVALARDGQEAIQMAMQMVPQIAFVSYELPGISGPQTCEILNTLAPDIMSVLVSDTKSQEKIESALKSGARGFLTRPLQKRELVHVIDDLAEIRKRRESSEVQEWKDPARFPKIVTVTGAKGGVGKSTVAVNLAVLLAKRVPNRVALIDLYTQFGDVATMFNVAPKHTIADMAPVAKDLDPDLVQNYVSKHPSGVHLLVASVNPLPLDSVGVECLDNLLHVLKRTYRYVVIDMPPILHAATLHVLAHSNIILLVANLFDLATATDTKKLYDALQEEHISKQNIKIILNRVSKANRLHTADIEQMFESGILAHIPNDCRLVSAMNQGVPLMVHDGDSHLGRSMARLAGTVAGFADDYLGAEKASSGGKKILRAK